MDIDPDRLRAVLGALAGACIYGLVQFGAVALGGRPVYGLPVVLQGAPVFPPLPKNTSKES